MGLGIPEASIVHIDKRVMVRVYSLINALLVPLMVISAMLSETTFEIYQRFFELLVLTILIGSVITQRFNRQELILILVFFVSQIGSVLTNSPSVFMLNAKQLGLAVFAAIYFRRHATNIISIHIAFIVCVALIIFQIFSGYFPFSISQYMKYLGNDMNARPLGLFINYHYSAFFIAVYLIGFTKKRNLYFLDFLLIYFTGVRTSLLSYIGQKMVSVFGKRFGLGSFKGQILLLLAALIVAISSLGLVQLFYERLDQQNNSLFVIAYQIADFNTYVRMLTIFPSDMTPFVMGGIYDYTGMGIEGFAEHGNELFIVTLFVQGGFFLALLYLTFLLKTLPSYQFFILLSIFHYSYLFSPLIIYVVYMFDGSQKAIGK